MLRPGVLDGRTVAVAGTAPELTASLERDGARVLAVPELLAGLAVDTLVVDSGPAFRACGGGYDGLRAGLDGAWRATREVAGERWVGAGEGGQVVLLAPPPGAGRHAAALRAALENLARTLGTEWARHQVTTVAVLPGDRTTAPALDRLVAWLASPAGAYLTGTALTLDREL